MNDLFTTTILPEPTRDAGLAQLTAFAPKAGRAYASERNHDRGPGAHRSVSQLSPYLRHRLILEREVLASVGEHHSASAADKFISEVFWRTYFKGFLERRPSIWAAYRRDLQAVDAEARRDRALAANIDAAEESRTGIDAFDHWARELRDTGYLHNHARMWFASIWIFTLNLPWQAGADFFLRHLLDGDPASNTLSWRWVGGLHTKGRTYLARRDNIARYTEGRFSPQGLAASAEPLTEDDEHPLLPVPQPAERPAGEVLTLIHEDDCVPETLGLCDGPSAALVCAKGRSDRPIDPMVEAFAAGAVTDAARRSGLEGAPQPGTTTSEDDLAHIVQTASDAGLATIAAPYAPVGPVADRLAMLERLAAEAGIRLVEVLRPEDAAAWVYADRGFFKLRKAIPKLMT